MSARRLLSNCGARAPEHVGSVVVVHGLISCWSAGLGAPRHVGSSFPDQGSNPRPLHWKADSEPLDHQEVPQCGILE